MFTTNAPLSHDELAFRPSPAVTVGVELELQIVDPDNWGELCARGAAFSTPVPTRASPMWTRNSWQSMLEVKTGVCRDTAEARHQLLPLLRRVRAVAATLGYQLAVGGTHPFSKPNLCLVLLFLSPLSSLRETPIFFHVLAEAPQRRPQKRSDTITASTLLILLFCR